MGQEIIIRDSNVNINAGSAAATDAAQRMSTEATSELAKKGAIKGGAEPYGCGEQSADTKGVLHKPGDDSQRSDADTVAHGPINKKGEDSQQPSSSGSDSGVYHPSKVEPLQPINPADEKFRPKSQDGGEKTPAIPHDKSKAPGQDKCEDPNAIVFTNPYGNKK